MFQELTNLNVAVVGYGVTGQACAEFLHKRKAQVSIFDAKPIKLDTSHFHTDDFDEQTDFSSFQFVVVSPGIDPRIKSLSHYQQNGGLLISEIELFAWFNTATTIGITGSNGKSTVTEMLGHVLNQSGYKVAVGGNLGQSAITFVEQGYDFIVLELSSFQLQLTESLNLKLAVLLNISADHLDRHGDMEAYLACKQKIFKHAEHAICIESIPESFPPEVYPHIKNIVVSTITHSSAAMGLAINKTTHAIEHDKIEVLSLDKLSVFGQHNYLNALVCCAMAMQLDVGLQAIANALYSFKGLDHRTQVVKQGQITWVNDSKATNLGATLAALNGIDEKSTLLVLIVGGDAKGANVEELADFIGTKIKGMVGLGKDAHMFEKLCVLHNQSNALKCEYSRADNMKNAVEKAVLICNQTKAHFPELKPLVMLSPACASIDMFANYRARGDEFTLAALAQEA
jgi:UDP-N-acetylmuramoylalanine--D-glutamate ligase